MHDVTLRASNARGGNGAVHAATARTARCAATGLALSLRPLAGGQAIAAAWADLAGRALAPNIFYEPEYALPAARPFGHGVQLLAVHADAAPGAPLLAVWPFRVARFRWGVPLAAVIGWQHPFAASGAPLIDRERCDEALDALLAVAACFGLPRRALLPLIPDEGPLAEALDRAMTRRGLRESRTEGHDRALFTPGKEGDVLAHLSSGSRSKLRQEYRRLEKEGAVSLNVVEAPEELGRALDTYLELEARGWKGRAGTAIPESAAETDFIRGVVRNLGAQGRVRFNELRLGERVIASSITYRHGAAAWYAKISFDEEFARNSPGSQLVVKVTEAMNADASLGFVDSCAPPLHPLMRRFWPERMSLSHRMMELAGGDAFFPLAVKLEEQRPRARAAYHAARNWLNRRRTTA